MAENQEANQEAEKTSKYQSFVNFLRQAIHPIQSIKSYIVHHSRDYKGLDKTHNVLIDNYVDLAGNFHNQKEEKESLVTQVSGLEEKRSRILDELCGVATEYEKAKITIKERDNLIASQKSAIYSKNRENKDLLLGIKEQDKKYDALYSEIQKYFQTRGVGTEEERKKEANLFVRLITKYNLKSKRLNKIMYKKGLDGLERVYKKLKKQKARKKLAEMKKEKKKN